jgi:hypothetical protein
MDLFLFTAHHVIALLCEHTDCSDIIFTTQHDQSAIIQCALNTLRAYACDICVCESSCGYLSCDLGKLSTFRVDFTVYIIGHIIVYLHTGTPRDIQ